MNAAADPKVPSALIHRVRANVFAREAEWRLEGDRLFWRATDDGGQGVMALEAVASVRLTVEPGRGGTRRLCRISSRDGSALLISSLHLASALRTQDRAESFAALVRALTRRVAQLNPHARFLTGARPAAWFTIVGGLASLGAALGLMTMRFGAEMLTSRLMIGVALVALGMPNLIRWLVANKPGVFDPAQPPLG